MTSIEFKAALQANPFRPFRVHLGSGRVIEITNPSLVVVSSTNRAAFAYRPGSDAFDVLDLILVDSLEFSDQSGGQRSVA